MRININKSVEVDDDAVVQIGTDFLNWLDARGLQLKDKDVYGVNIPEDASYEEMAKLWVFGTDNE